MKAVEFQLHPLSNRIQILIAHLQGNLPLQGEKERHAYVWTATRIIVLKLFLKIQGFCSKTKTEQEKLRNCGFDSCFKNSVYNLHEKKINRSINRRF